MSAFCPKDYTACPDDICHGAGCLKMNGHPMLEECDVCGGLINPEFPDSSDCTCDEEYDDGC